MAGVKGRSGGPRPNSGGKRPGAGRKPKAPPAKSANPARADGAEVVTGLEAQPHGGALKRSKAETPEPGQALVDGKTRDPLEFLELVLNDPTAPLKERIRAAVAAAQYRHTKRHDGGKKEETAERAAKAAKGKFGARPAPLKLVGGGG